MPPKVLHGFLLEILLNFTKISPGSSFFKVPSNSRTDTNRIRQEFLLAALCSYSLNNLHSICFEDFWESSSKQSCKENKVDWGNIYTKLIFTTSTSSIGRIDLVLFDNIPFTFLLSRIATLVIYDFFLRSTHLDP